MRIVRFCIILFCVEFCNPIFAQQKPEISGYFSDMPSVIGLDMPLTLLSEWNWQNLIHNRLNISWQFTPDWRLDGSARNRLLTGSQYLIQPSEISFDKAWATLSWNYFTSANALLNTTLDRLFITFERKKWKLQLGRQRINWGQTLVWNPNDVFNAYSFFDFDYPERPGCDALRITFFQSATASSEVAASTNHYGKTTVALMHHWNWNNIDFQAIGGVFESSDAVLGGAWTGDIKGINLRGEFSFFQALQNFSDTTTTVAVSVGMDYLFSNQLLLQAEVLYNNVGKFGNFLSLMNASQLSAKTLSICDWNVFVQASYPLTQRLNGSLSSMYFIDIKACYVGFSMDYSLSENLDLSLISQLFTTLQNNRTTDMKALLGFLRLKYSF
jgi:hypothetical protein